MCRLGHLVKDFRGGHQMSDRLKGTAMAVLSSRGNPQRGQFEQVPQLMACPSFAR